ncbi:hypothetical protein KR51_00015610 [Rubidibacter lacunae KORDI 51-2]|uniref:Uncharacterized protein n=1 Tax=Rubidibacter lacunae KORDI 51-2 TaxID=582515 RepID=U5DJ53_9CHRO|nr:hypothetical protein [Rubidibacter lacunae]ERN41716.1 hypothetical protein KR51_00015610 [Rubidibacter lacunae KORDI 51-2]
MLCARFGAKGSSLPLSAIDPAGSIAVQGGAIADHSSGHTVQPRRSRAPGRVHAATILTT